MQYIIPLNTNSVFISELSTIFIREGTCLVCLFLKTKPSEHRTDQGHTNLVIMEGKKMNFWAKLREMTWSFNLQEILINRKISRYKNYYRIFKSYNVCDSILAYYRVFFFFQWSFNVFLLSQVTPHFQRRLTDNAFF